MNRFFDVDGDVCTQLAPWITAAMQWNGKPTTKRQSLFRLENALRFRSDIADGIIAVLPGFISDLASVPREAWALFMAPDDPRIALGAWVHDLLYQAEGDITLEDGTKRSLSRNQADHILAFEAMPDLGATHLESQLVYEALLCFGERWKGTPKLKLNQNQRSQ